MSGQASRCERRAIGLRHAQPAGKLRLSFTLAHPHIVKFGMSRWLAAFRRVVFAFRRLAGRPEMRPSKGPSALSVLRTGSRGIGMPRTARAGTGDAVYGPPCIPPMKPSARKAMMMPIKIHLPMRPSCPAV